ncbi:Blue-copper-protein-like protein [Hyella patelloides LEGE 07179]|uniref:Blue-copper-protein-like protein n=2 Tax=Hyella TaxID=945733 RepID=A0A563VVM2_9CYAN|nr:Blue-copper-protein-like protein [Hyella patelloides LEGE 07179]
MNLIKQCFHRKLWQIITVLFMIVICHSFLVIPTALANSQIKEIKVSLGNSQGELRFFPSSLQFETGQQYKLLLDNPSPTKHYFTSKDFADASWTRKVEAGKVEIKGAIHELELKPGSTAEWVLTPMKSGKYELHCSVAGHTEAGMIGKIIIND